MTVDFESFNDVLKHPIRRKVILALGNNKNLSYVELLNITEAANTGKFNYHLKILADLIQKDDAGKYNLTEKGQLALEFLQKFPEKRPEPPKSLHMADAALIGLVGILLIAANPTLWVGLWLDSNTYTVPAFTLPFFGLGSLLYALLLPGFAMWTLAVRRTHSHEMYSLLRAPLIAFLVLIAVLAVMVLTSFKFNLVAEIKTPLLIVEQGPNWSHTTQQLTMVSLASNFMQGLVFSFVGVALVELASKIKRRLSRS